jgi:hypothetical protein
MRQLLAHAPRILAGVVLVMSGAYLMIYLYRWEWNRAIISGLFFVGAEVAVATAMIMRRMRRLEDTARATQDEARPSPLVLDRLRSTPVNRPDPFAWLKPGAGRTGVFVPVLLGAGVILSALAYAVERIAEATAVPLIDRRIAARMSALAPPANGLSGSSPRIETTDKTRAQPRFASIAGTLLAVAGLGVLAWLGVGALLDATQSRPDPADRPAQTTIELAIAQRGVPKPTVATAEALWVGCASVLGSQATTASVVARGGDRVTLVLEPGVGELGVRRLTGCLSDLRVNKVRADVLSVESTPQATTARGNASSS